MYCNVIDAPNLCHKKFEIINSDAKKWLKCIEDQSIDCIITDPPYWSLNKWRNVGTTTRLGGNRDKQKQTGWFPTIDSNDLWEYLNEFWRILKNNTHCYIMCDPIVLRYLLSYADDMDWRFVKPLIWDKVLLGMGYHYRCRYEFIIMLEKGKRKLNNLSIPDILTHKRITNQYPTQKPVDLMKDLIMQSTQENEVVIDPFMGVGTTGIAAVSLNRIFKGCDISKEAFKIAYNTFSTY